jgi:hypothetical protein
MQIAELIQAMIDGENDHIAPARQRLTVDPRP